MFKRIVFGSIIVITTGLFLLAVFSLTLYSGISKEKNYLISDNEPVLLGDSKYKIDWIFKEYNSSEDVLGLTEDGILVLHDLKDIYIYDKKHGASKKIASCRYGNIKEVYKISGQRFLLHYVDKIFNNLSFYKRKLKDDDYNYSYSDGDYSDKNWIEVYDSQKKDYEMLFDKRRKWKVIKSLGTCFQDFQGVGCSNNGKFAVWCVENEIGKFQISLYYAEKKTKKDYFIEAKKSFDIIYDIKVSDDGQTLFFIGVRTNDVLTQRSLYRLDLRKKELEHQLLINDVNSYEISFDDKYIIYDFKENKYDKKSYALSCMDLLTLRSYVINDAIINSSYSVSSTGNTMAYVVDKGESAQIYINYFGKKASNGCSIYTVNEINTNNKVLVKWIDSDGKLLISYGNPSIQHQSEKNSIFFIDISRYY